MQEGPQEVKTTTYYCRGCVHLTTEAWEYECEDDYMDRGTDAICTKENKYISSYYRSGDRSPDWCPYILK